ncbi:hypothetical protein D4765_07235 [Subtercola vilae]|uniref:Polysaccharide biosynthesis protein n=1 Tax=Subtercola vilae TaxID=2056433 RepID=A0A4T2C291_9MICO|nr:hypothetical protein D4765_07235 [Subtercola vilae]
MAGFGSYVLLVVVARGTASTPAEYSNFAVFWSLTVTIGLGFFYPLEQETARSIAGTKPVEGGRMARYVVTCGGALAVVTSILALVLLTPWGVSYIGEPGLVVALVLSFVGYAVQYPIRGLMSGSHRTTHYSAILAVEGALRIGLPLGVLIVGIHSALPFAFVVPLAAAASVLPVFIQRDRSWLRYDRVRPALFNSRLARLVIAALSIQLILNSGTLLAKALGDPATDSLTGQILNCLSIARVPVFAYQVVQILYLPRLAAQWKSNDVRGVKQTLMVAIGAALAIGVVLTVGMVWLGPWVLSLLFGSALVLSGQGILLVSLGVAVFLIALVTSDGSLALGLHSLVIRSWALGVVAAAVPVLLLHDDVARVTAPLIVGASVALVQLAVGLGLRVSRTSHTASPAANIASNEY